MPKPKATQASLIDPNGIHSNFSPFIPSVVPRIRAANPALSGLLNGVAMLGSVGAVGCLPVLLRSGILRAHLIAEIVVFAAETLTLFLEGLNVTILLGQLVLQFANLPGSASLGESFRLLTLSLWVTFVALDLLFETESVEDHDICPVEDQGQEEGEATEVHIALRVELACLDFHTSRPFEHGRARMTFSSRIDGIYDL